MESKKHRPVAINEAAKALGHRGGLKGGPARAKVLSPARRKEIAAKGGRAAHGKN